MKAWKFWLAFAGMLALISFIFGLGFRSFSGQIAAQGQRLEYLGNGLAKTQAQVVEKKKLMDALAKEYSSMDKKYRKEVLARVAIQARLDEISGGGQAAVSPDSAVLNNVDLWVRYLFAPGRFDYRIKERPLAVGVLQLENGGWIGDITDIRTGKKLKIDSLNVLARVQTIPWYRKVSGGGALGYLDGPLLGASLGYGKTEVLALAGWREGLKVGGVYHKRFFGP